MTARRAALGLAAGAAAVVAILWLRRPPPIDLHPIAHQNVLLITIDTLRADALGSYGGPAATPTLDRLAAEGVRFDFAHAHAVLTLPSHASILTGQLPFQHGLRDNSGYRLPPAARTAATLLKKAGYATAAFVAAFPLHSRFGLTSGFDVYDDRFGEAHAPAEFDMPERPAAVVVPLARQWIAERRGSGRSGGSGRAGGERNPTGSSDLPGLPGQPWFLWLHLFDPHAPYRPPPPFDAQYALKPYYGEVAAVDAALAPLVDDLRNAGGSTLIVVTGDHGEGLGEHGEQSHGLFAYEATLRVPLIITEVGKVRLKPDITADQEARSLLSYVASRFGRTATGEVSSVSARHIDILPTILDAVGQPVPTDLPGRSLLTAAERRDGSERPVYFEAMSAMLNRGWAPLAGVIVGRDKLIDLPIAERYDLRADPAEQTNLAGRAADRERTLTAALRAFHATAPGERAAEDPQALARLRSLGYVSGQGTRKSAYTAADDPKTLVALDQDVHRAVEAFAAGRADEAIQIYQRVVDRRPDMAIAYRHLAFVQWRRGDLAGAITTLGRAIDHGVGDPRVRAQLGGYLTDAGRAADAIAILEPLARDPGADADTLNTLGIAYARSAKASLAQQVFERVLTMNPDSSIPLENLGLLALERGDVQSAGAYFDRAVRAAPISSRAYAGRGIVALRRGDHRAAFDAWTRAVQLDPANFDALYNLGVNLARDGQFDRARPYLEQFLRTAPEPLYGQERRDVSTLLRRRTP